MDHERQSTASFDSAADLLKSDLRGDLVRIRDADYEDARRIYNAMIDRRPEVIVRCAGVGDVIDAIKFGRAHGLPISVRGGGHNVTGNALADRGLTIDLSLMKGLRIDPRLRIVRAEAGLTWLEVNHDLQHFGLAAAGGFVGTTGVAGLTLGGGLGWLVRKHGLACDNLVSADIVTADGRFLQASKEDNPDLFWAIRGGGGNFGIVTSFEFEVHPAGTVLAGLVIHPASRAREAMKFWRDFETTAPRELTTGALLFTAPPAPFVPEDAQGTPVVGIGGVFTGDLEVGEKVLRPLRDWGSPVADIIEPMPYSAAQTMADALWPHNFQNYWKSDFLNGLPDDAIDTMVAKFSSVPSVMTTVVIEHNGDGAMNDVRRGDTAFWHRDSSYNLLVTSMWEDRRNAEENISWTKDFVEATARFASGGVYVNYLGEEGSDRIRSAFGSNFDRLTAVKQKYDPENVFRLNQNIEPAD
ncbi:FAD-binding oxidoreductase [Pseudonocardia sp. RS11V-5]|uniref:FAD-binding oxidoreductase n=1 Tax=Pseudonocardia terrae TaxID=2905831 RepID=UPI001E5E45AB|nr:FAD-binding oxidoreductase [Pseudonocardia terrae]MCE3552914.1 FAD-binding oxidoreductase [Pseudonocardia terrae]